MSAAYDLVVRIAPNDAEESEESARLAYRLRAELLGLDLEAVEPVIPAPVPGGAKGLGALGGLAVRLGTVALKNLVTRLRDWAARNNRGVEITIDGDTLKLTGATAEQQQQLLDVWLAKHAPSP